MAISKVTMNTNQPNIIIAGGGISGLSLAFFLKKELGPSIKLTVLEANAQPGGTIRTVRSGGYKIEAGPNGFLDNRPDTMELIHALGLSEKLEYARASARNRFVFARGKLRKIPVDPVSFIFSDLLSPAAKLRILAEPFLAPSKSEDEETLAAFFKRRFGAGVLENLADPAVSGIFGGSTQRLSARSAFPALARFEKQYGSVIKGWLLSRKAKERLESKAPAHRPQLASFKGGLEELIHTLAAKLEGHLLLKTKIGRFSNISHATRFSVSVEHADREVETPHADILVLAVPAYSAARIVESVDPELAGTLRQISYAPIGVVALGYPEKSVPTSPDGFGFLISAKERKEFLGAIWPSSVFSARAPAGKVLIQCLLGGSEHPEIVRLSEAELVRTTQRFLSEIMRIESAPEFVQTFRYERAIPQYTIGHAERLSRIDKRLERLPGLFITGNAYRGTGMNDCIEQSKRLAAHIAEFLKSALEPASYKS